MEKQGGLAKSSSLESSTVFSVEQLKQLYSRAVEEPNLSVPRNDLIKCPDCGEEILMIPTLSVMNVAIEKHVRYHKAQLKFDPFERQRTAIKIRLSLTSQVLQRACNLQKA